MLYLLPDLTVADVQVLCRRVRFLPRSGHLPHPYPVTTGTSLRFPRNTLDLHHLHYIRKYADLLRLERILFSSLESEKSTT